MSALPQPRFLAGPDRATPHALAVVPDPQDEAPEPFAPRELDRQELEPHELDSQDIDPEDVVALVQRTAATIRRLRQEADEAAAREAAARDALAQERAQWRDDVARLKDIAQACLARAAGAEADIEEAKAQTRVALLLRREAEAREREAAERAAAAETRAETAERWIAKIGQALAADVRGLLRD